jgi:hypothetical protein
VEFGFFRELFTSELVDRIPLSCQLLVAAAHSFRPFLELLLRRFKLPRELADHIPKVLQTCTDQLSFELGLIGNLRSAGGKTAAVGDTPAVGELPKARLHISTHFLSKLKVNLHPAVVFLSASIVWENYDMMCSI